MLQVEHVQQAEGQDAASEEGRGVLLHQAVQREVDAAMPRLMAACDSALACLARRTCPSVMASASATKRSWF